MDLETGKATPEVYSGKLKKRNTRIYFLNGKLYKIVKIDRSANICYLYEYETKEVKRFIYADFKKFRKNAYKMDRVAEMLNRHPDRIRRAIWNNEVKKPILVSSGNSGKYWFSEENIHELRDFFSTVHRGRPRKDGIVVSRNVPTKDELEALLGNKQMLYVKNKDGEFIPVWRAEEF